MSLLTDNPHLVDRPPDDGQPMWLTRDPDGCGLVWVKDGHIWKGYRL